MRVMFVDDEQRVLDGIERSMFGLDVDWELAFATSGRSALEQLTATPAQAVISDMRMPGMDGRELLTEVRSRWPDTLRVILSGFTEEEIALRSLEVVHQFLAKPCDGPSLVAVVERIASLRKLLASESLKRIVGRVGHLPSTPRIYLDLVRSVTNANSNAKSIAPILSRDPALAAKVLQVANSAFFRRGKPIANIGAAVTHIGLDTLRALILMMEVFRADSDEGAAAHLQQRALRATLIAEHVAAGETCANECAVAALLADVGQLIPGIEIHCKQAETNGEGTFRPSEVGAYLLGMWGLPMFIIEAVAYYETPWRVTPQSFGIAGVAHVAAMLARGKMPDVDYVTRCGFADRLDGWRAFAEKLPGP